MGWESNRLNLGGCFKKCFFYPDTWGNYPIWRAYFSHGLVQPPTRNFYFHSEVTEQDGWLWRWTSPERQNVRHQACWRKIRRISQWIFVENSATKKKTWANFCQASIFFVQRGGNKKTPSQLLGGGNSNSFYFQPYLGKMHPIWRAYFSDGLKPPISIVDCGCVFSLSLGFVSYIQDPVKCGHEKIHKKQGWFIYYR